MMKGDLSANKTVRYTTDDYRESHKSIALTCPYEKNS